MHWVLGTVQLGMPYGIGNQSGQPDIEEAFKILEMALKNNVVIWDTAPAYGNSEKIIGQYIAKNKRTPIICTKLPSLSRNIPANSSLDDMREFVWHHLQGSLQKLGLSRVNTYFIHDERDLEFSDLDIVQVLGELKKMGSIKKIGISVYSPDLAFSALKTNLFDAIQVPYNLFDRRFQEVIMFADKIGVDVYVRSIFLQGLFFLSIDEVARKLPEAVPYVAELKEIAKSTNRTIAELVIGYIKGNSAISHVLVGIEKLSQLQENIQLFKSKPLSLDLQQELENRFGNVPIQVINPTLWNNL